MTDNETRPSVTVYLCADGAAEAIEWYTRVFGARERYRLPNPDGRLGHAEITIGETVLMLSDEWPDGGVVSPIKQQGHSHSLVLAVADADAVFARAVEAGAAVDRAVKDEPYGRGGWLVDPFGHHWNVMTPNPDFDPSQIEG